MITTNYPKVACVSMLTPATSEYYKKLKKEGVEAVIVCLRISDVNCYKYAAMHTKLAHEAEMTSHAYMITNLYEPTEDAIFFAKNFTSLNYSSDSKITIVINADKYVEDREKKILQIMDLVSRYHSRKNIDLAFYKHDLDKGLYDLDKLPKMINLTIINCGGLSAGIPNAGTWVYESKIGDVVQALAYDYYGYYTSNDYQLSLIDSDYLVQHGDTWYSISRRHGIPILDLLELNSAAPDERLFEGQVVKIA